MLALSAKDFREMRLVHTDRAFPDRDFVTKMLSFRIADQTNEPLPSGEQWLAYDVEIVECRYASGSFEQVEMA